MNSTAKKIKKETILLSKMLSVNGIDCRFIEDPNFTEIPDFWVEVEKDESYLEIDVTYNGNYSVLLNSEIIDGEFNISELIEFLKNVH